MCECICVCLANFIFERVCVDVCVNIFVNSTSEYVLHLHVKEESVLIHSTLFAYIEMSLISCTLATFPNFILCWPMQSEQKFSKIFSQPSFCLSD